MLDETYEGETSEGEHSSEVGDDSQTSTEESSTSGKTVPVGRFNEVYKENKELSAKLKESQKEDTSTQTDSEKKAEDYLRGLFNKIQEENKSAETTAEKEEQRQFNEDLDNTLSVHTNVDRAEFKTFIEEKSESFGFSSVENAMNVYLEMNNIAKETEEQTKDNISQKPSLPRNEGSAPSNTEHDDSEKSIFQIGEELAQEAESKTK